MEAVTDFIFMGSKITADGDCIHESKRRLLHGSTGKTNLDSAFKGRDVALLTKTHQVSDAIQPSHPLSTSPPAFSLTQNEGLFQ